MKINFACGRQTWDGYYCIDAIQHPKASRPVDLRHAFCFDGPRLLNPLPLEAQCATEVHAYHFIEHVYRWEAPAVIHEFARLLRPSGRLVLELPNLDEVTANLRRGADDQMTLWPLYGDPRHQDPYMCHRWAYTAQTITALLQGCGLRYVEIRPPLTHGRRVNRDMRVEARK